MSFEDKKGEAIPDLQAELTAAVSRWGDRLLAADPDELDDIKQQALGELNPLWSYTNEPCSFSGVAHYKTIDADGNSEIHYGRLVSEGISKGFDIGHLGPQNRPEIYYSFVHRVVSLWDGPLDYTQHNLVVFMEMGGSVVPLRELDKAFESESSEPAGDATLTFMEDTESATQRLEMLYQSREFLRASLRLQREMVDSVTEEFDQKYIALRGVAMTMQTERCVRPLVVNGRQVQQKLSIAGKVIRGTFMGFDSLERGRLNTKPIRSSRDVADDAAGFCMVVEVEDSGEHPVLQTSDVILVPMLAQPFNLGFAEP